MTLVLHNINTQHSSDEFYMDMFGQQVNWTAEFFYQVKVTNFCLV